MSTPSGEWEIERFFLGDEEITRPEWVRAERRAGFWPHGEDRGQLATGGFGGRGLHGTYRTYFTSPVELENRYGAACQNCGHTITNVYEATYVTPTPVIVYRHLNRAYEHGIGPRECELPPIRLTAEPVAHSRVNI